MKTFIGSFEVGFVEVNADFPGAHMASDGEFAALQLKSVLTRRALRYEAEAPVHDFVDAESKMASPDAEVRESGRLQKEALLARRLQIKAELPKP